MLLQKALLRLFSLPPYSIIVIYVSGYAIAEEKRSQQPNSAKVQIHSHTPAGQLSRLRKKMGMLARNTSGAERSARWAMRSLRRMSPMI